jgi:hypothetical protein
MVLGDLPDDCEAEPGSGSAAGGFRTVEAVEDERPVGFGDAGAVVADGHLSADNRQFDAAASVAPLGGVLDEVPDGPFELFPVTPDRGRIGLELEVEAREACLCPLDDAIRQLIEPDVLEMEVSLTAAGEFDRVRDEGRELFQLPRDVAEKAISVVVAELDPLAEEVDGRFSWSFWVCCSSLRPSDRRGRRRGERGAGLRSAMSVAGARSRSYGNGFRLSEPLSTLVHCHGFPQTALRSELKSMSRKAPRTRRRRSPPYREGVAFLLLQTTIMCAFQGFCRST